jgi:hypothetical protein
MRAGCAQIVTLCVWRRAVRGVTLGLQPASGSRFLYLGAALVGGLTPATNSTAPIRHRLPDFLQRTFPGTPGVSDPTARQCRGDHAPLPQARPVRTGSWTRSIAKILTSRPHMPRCGRLCDGHEVFFLAASGQIRMTANNLVTPRRESCDQALHRLQVGHGPPSSGRVLPICISDLLTFSYQSLAKSY